MLAIPSENRVHPITDQSEWPFMRPPVSMVAASHPLHLVRLQEMDAAFGIFTATMVGYLALKQDLISLATDRLVGRDTAGTGGIEAIALTGGLEFTGSGSIRIADAGVTMAKLASMTEATVIGRAAGGGDGTPTGLSSAQLSTILGLGTMATQSAASVAITGGTITGLGSPSGSSDAATKGYVDGLVQGLKWKNSVRVATTAAGTLATSFENGDTIDGVTLATGDRLLIKNQAAAAENGIYVVASSGAPARAADADAGSELASAVVTVEQGTANADKVFMCYTNAPITLESTSVLWGDFVTMIQAAPSVHGHLASDSTVATDLFDGSLVGFAGTTVQELFDYIDDNFPPP